MNNNVKSDYKSQQLFLNDAKDAAVEVIEIIKMITKENDAEYVYISGVPRGGIPTMYAVMVAVASIDTGAFHSLRVTDDMSLAHIIIDDLVDSGSTKWKCKQAHSDARFVTVYEKPPRFIDFPWEVLPPGHPDLEVDLSELYDVSITNLGPVPSNIRDHYVRICQYYGRSVDEVSIQQMHKFVYDHIDRIGNDIDLSSI